KRDDHIDRRSKHRVVARIVEWPGIAEGMIDAHLGTNGQARERLWNRRLDVEIDRESAISGPAAADRARIDHRFASERAHRIMRVGELRGIEALGIAPDFAADLGRDL